MSKILSFTKIDSLIKHENTDLKTTLKYEYEDNVYEIVVKKYVGLNDVLDIVYGVLSVVFAKDEDGETHYFPGLLDYAKAAYIMEKFTNLKHDMGADRVFALMYGGDIYDRIISAINEAQLQHIDTAIQKAIDYELRVIASFERGQIAHAIEKLDQATSAFTALTEHIQTVDSDKLASIFDNLSKIDETTLVNAVIGVNEGNER
ncbi:MAG: hypothetical protein GX957_10545 [Clostridiaceae bacterium]|nr:hypothetical protein [Clostridiaceae bacterium]